MIIIFKLLFVIIIQEKVDLHKQAYFKILEFFYPNQQVPKLITMYIFGPTWSIPQSVISEGTVSSHCCC